MSTRLAWVLSMPLVAALAACQDSPAAAVNPPATANMVASSRVDQAHFLGNGVRGGVGWFSSDGSGGYVSGSLSVLTGNADTLNPDASRAFLDYYVAQCDAYYNCTYSFGYGLIPAEDVRSTGASNHELHLSTNTTGNPDFFATTPGQVTVDWAANGIYTASSRGMNTFSMPGFTQRQEGTSTDASASAAGDIAGTRIPPGSEGLIGSSHNLLITITR